MSIAMRSRVGWLAVIGALIINLGCADDEVLPGPTPTPTTVTDTFEGAINRNGAASHSFVVAASGAVTATLNELIPTTDPNPADAEPFKVGFGVGTWDGTVCTLVAARDKAPGTTVIYGNVNAPGTLCVRIYDTGEVVDTATYKVTVVHP